MPTAPSVPRPDPRGERSRWDDPRPGDVRVRGHPGVTIDPEAPIPVPEDVLLVGSDLDGTLLAPDLQVGPRALAALPRMAAAGVELVYVTGRPPRWMRPIVAQTGHSGMAVCANGALLVDLAEERLVRRTTIDPALAAAVTMRLRELVPGITFAVERLMIDAGRARDLGELTVVGFEPQYDSPWARLPGVEVGEILDLIDRGDPVKILATPPVGSDHDSDSLVALAEAEFTGVLHITHSGARNALVEIMSGEIDKGVGFLEVAAMRGVDPIRTVGVGDQPNDVALIRTSGTGYAVANAHPDARAAADHVIPSNTDDGVGRLLEAILATRR